MNQQQYLSLVLELSGIAPSLRAQGHRMDAGETLLMQRALEHMKAQTFDVIFEETKSARLIPMDTAIPAGADTTTYQQFNQSGGAEIISNLADDFPVVNVFGREFTDKICSVGSSYIWTIQDVRRATMAGVDFESQLTTAARESIERRSDRIGFEGSVEKGFTGLANNANVTIFTLPNGGAWSTLTPAEILANMNAQANAVNDDSGERFPPDTMILPGAEFDLVSTTPFLGGDGTETILQVFLRNQPFVRSVERWTRLNAAGAGGEPRVMCYQRTPTVVQWNVPVPFEQFPPQPRNMALKVNVHARVGAVEFHYPVGANYADIS